MKSLPDILRKNGFDYYLVIRSEKVACYEQRYSENVKYYEIFIIKVKHEQNLFGRFYKERELFPADSDFGKSAWSFRNLDDAIKKFRELVEKEKKKNPQNTFDSS